MKLLISRMNGDTEFMGLKFRFQSWVFSIFSLNKMKGLRRLGFQYLHLACLYGEGLAESNVWVGIWLAKTQVGLEW